jgi:hypothetical protein
MKNTFLIIFIIVLALKFIQVEKTNPKANLDLEIKANKEIMDIFKKACYDCHSNDTKWPWYSKIAPMSWSIVSHVDNGRKWLNFSIWESYKKEEKSKKLREIFRAVYLAMPPSDYIYFHENASLSKEEIVKIRDWTGVMK